MKLLKLMACAALLCGIATFANAACAGGPCTPTSPTVPPIVCKAGFEKNAEGICVKTQVACPPVTEPQCGPNQNMKLNPKDANGCKVASTCVDIRAAETCPTYAVPTCTNGMELKKGDVWANGCTGPSRCVAKGTCPVFATPSCGAGQVLVPGHAKPNGCMSAPFCKSATAPAAASGENPTGY